MSVRITQESLTHTTLANIKANFKKMEDIQEKLSSGKQLNRASDNPSNTRKVLGLKTKDHQVQQYLDNSHAAKDQVNFAFNALEGIQDTIAKVKELTIQANNDTLGPSERKVIASELGQIMESVIQFANMDNNGRYIFAGTKTQTVPFSAVKDGSGKITSVSYNGDNQEIKYQVGPNSHIQVNIPGGKLFQDNHIFSTLISLRDSLEASTFNSAAFSDLRATLESTTDVFSAEITKFGSKANRLDMTVSRLENSQASLKELISYNEDADVASLIMDLKHQENTLNASLNVGAKIIQPTLLNFL